jgi:hypothetical protein
MPRGVRRNKLDSQILGIVCQHQQPISVRAICALAFPGLSWEDARTRVRPWPEHEGVLASAAWLVHWRCRVLARKRVLQRTDPITTDTFSACPEVAPCPAR